MLWMRYRYARVCVMCMMIVVVVCVMVVVVVVCSGSGGVCGVILISNLKLNTLLFYYIFYWVHIFWYVNNVFCFLD